MNLKQIEERMAAIKAELQKDDVDVTALRTEFDELKEQRDAILKEAEERTKLLDDIANERIGVRVEMKVNEKENERKEGEDPHYRNAFLKSLLGLTLTDEESRAYIHTTENTSAVIPKELENKIYSQMAESHPILSDINIIRSGVVLQITKHVSIDEGDAKNVAEGVANEDEKNTFVAVDLSGKDISKHIDFSYRLGKMAIPAFEAYLVEEIGSRIGSQWAKNVIAQIKADVATANKIDAKTPGTLVIGDITDALSKLKGVGQVIVYGNNTTFYSDVASMKDADTKISFISDYTKGISGQILGKPYKEEDALADGELLFLDPKQFTENVVQDLLIERDKDIKKHVHTIAGIVITGGVLTNDKAGALLTVGQAG